MALQYSNLKISIEKNTNRYYIYYRITMPDGIVEKRKEFGKTYKISMVGGTQRQNEKNANYLLELIREDLEDGIDPKYREKQVEERFEKQLIEAQKKENAKVCIETAIEWLREEKGWINPKEGQEHTASIVTSFLKNSVTRYFKKIGKADDIRLVNKMDIQNFIEENFNRKSDVVHTGRGQFKQEGWSSLTCSLNNTKIGYLFGVLVDKNIIDVNPARGVKIKKDHQKLLQPKEEDEAEIDKYEPWTAKEAELFFADYGDELDLVNRSLHTMGSIVHYCFIRKSELMRLKCIMLDLDNYKINIPAKKTKSARKYTSNEIVSIRIPVKLVKILRKYLAFRFPDGFENDDYLLYQKDSKKKYTYGTAINQFGRLRAVMQAKHHGHYVDKQIYALKHTGVIKLYQTLLKSDKKPAEIQKILQAHCRHSNWSETANYLRKSCKIEIEGETEILDF